MKILKTICILLFTVCNVQSLTAAIPANVFPRQQCIPLKVTTNTRSATSLDDMLHQRFSFSSNRPISAMIAWEQNGTDYNSSADLAGENIDRIDRVVQSNHFLFFIYKNIITDENTKTSQVSPAKEWDEILTYVASFYERYLKIDYSIPIFVQIGNPLKKGIPDIPFDQRYSSFNTRIYETGTDFIEGLIKGNEYTAFGWVLQEESNIKELLIPDEKSLLPDRNRLPYLFDQINTTLGFDWEIWRDKGMCNLINNFRGEIITPEARNANGGFPIQFKYNPSFPTVIAFYPYYLVDIYEDVSTNSNAPYYDRGLLSVWSNPEENTNPNLHLGNATLATLNSLGWKLKPGVTYSSSKFTGRLWEDNKESDDNHPCWISLEDTLYYDLNPSSYPNKSTLKEFYLATPYLFKDWKNLRASINNLNEYWMDRVKSEDLLAYLDSHYLDIDWDQNYRIPLLINRYFEDKTWWNYEIMVDEILFKGLQLSRSYKLYDLYPSSPNIMMNLRNHIYSILPESVMDDRLSKIKENQLDKWDRFIEENDWMDWLKQYEIKEYCENDDNYSTLKKWFLENPESYYESILLDLSQKICAWWGFQSPNLTPQEDPMIKNTQQILMRKYPLDKVLEGYGISGIESIVITSDIKAICSKDGVFRLSSDIPYSIYSISGSVIVQNHQGEYRLPDHGMYIIRAYNKSFKIVY